MCSCLEKENNEVITLSESVNVKAKQICRQKCKKGYEITIFVAYQVHGKMRTHYSSGNFQFFNVRAIFHEVL